MRWDQRSRLCQVLRLGGYVSFDLPRTVTALGALMLTGIAASHGYVLIVDAPLPAYFAFYAAGVITACLVVAGLLWLAFKPAVAQVSWFVGDLVCLALLGIYFASRAVSLPGLVAVTGRWDFAPGTFTFVLAGAFLVLHMSVLLGINVSYPRRQNWRD